MDHALNYLGEVLGIDFVLTIETSPGVVDLYFKDNDSGAYAASVTVASGTPGHRFIDYSYVNVASNWSGGTSDINSYTYQTISHEILHALGLGHAGNYNGTANFVTDTTNPNYGNNSNVALNDSWQMSIMSYFDQNQNTELVASRA